MGKDKVTGIDKAKKKAVLRQADEFRRLARHINGKDAQAMPLFTGEVRRMPRTYHQEITHDGTFRLLVESSNRTVKTVSTDLFSHDVITFCSDYLEDDEFFGAMVGAGVEKFFKFWKFYTKPIKELRILALKSYKGMCYARTDFDVNQDYEPGDYSALDVLLANKKNKLAVKLFLGSLFDPKADLSQTLIMYGEGKNGKSTFINFLWDCFGDAISNASAPSEKDMTRFTAQFVDKRLGVFPDAAHTNFMQSQEFKMMTGGDVVAIDEKWEKKYRKRLNCKFIVSTNHKPKCKGQLSDTRRLIYYELLPVAVKDDELGDRLYEQREAIFSHCIDLYNLHAGSGRDLPVAADQIKGVLEDSSIEEREFFNEYFEVNPKLQTSVATINKCISDHYGKSWGGKVKFRAHLDLWLRRVIKCDTAKVLSNGKIRFRGYCNFGTKYSKGHLACSNTDVIKAEESSKE